MLTVDLLDHVASHILADRADYVEGSSGELWPNETLLLYLNEAQQLFARESFCLRDSTTEAVCSIQLVNATATYALHASVLHIYNVWLSDNPQRLSHISAIHTTDDDLSLTLTTADRPLGYWLDSDFRKITVMPTPNTTAAALKLKLSVARLPIDALVISPTSTPEIPVEFHLDLCDWVAFRALSHQELDSEAKADANSFRANFFQAARRARRNTQILTEPYTQFEFGGWGNG